MFLIFIFFQSKYYSIFTLKIQDFNRKKIMGSMLFLPDSDLVKLYKNCTRLQKRLK